MSLLIKYCVVLIVICSVILGFLPATLSTHWGKNQAVALVNALIPGQIMIERLQLQWGKEQAIHGLQLRDGHGHSILQVAKISSNTPLWQLFLRGWTFTDVNIEHLNANLVMCNGYWENLRHALGMALPNDTSSTTVFDLEDVNAKIRSGVPMLAGVEGGIRHQDQKGYFQFFCTLHDFRVSNWTNLTRAIQDYFLNRINPKDTLKLRLTNFPAILFDSIALFQKENFKGIFQDFFGKNLMIEFATTPRIENGIILAIKAPQMESNIQGKLSEDRLEFAGPSSINMRFTPPFVNRFIPDRLALESVAPVKLTISQLSAPLSFFQKPVDQADFLAWGFDLNVELSTTDLRLRPPGLIHVDKYEFHFDSPADSTKMHVKILGKANHYVTPIDINYERSWAKPKTLKALLTPITRSISPQ